MVLLISRFFKTLSVDLNPNGNGRANDFRLTLAKEGSGLMKESFCDVR